MKYMWYIYIYDYIPYIVMRLWLLLILCLNFKPALLRYKLHRQIHQFYVYIGWVLTYIYGCVTITAVKILTFPLLPEFPCCPSAVNHLLPLLVLDKYSSALCHCDFVCFRISYKLNKLCVFFSVVFFGLHYVFSIHLCFICS